MVLVITSRLLIAHREALLVVRLPPSSVSSNFNRGGKGQRETRLHNFEPRLSLQTLPTTFFTSSVPGLFPLSREEATRPRKLLRTG